MFFIDKEGDIHSIYDTGGVPQRPILKSKNARAAGTYNSRETGKGPGLRAGGRTKGMVRTVGKQKSGR